jgi:glycosyltransferase involved in cell wall biosynthesis
VKVGFYYHLGVLTEAGIAAPHHMAMFIEELARQAGLVRYLAHRGPRSKVDDTVLSSSLVPGVDIGPKRSAPMRSLTPAVRAFDPRSVDVLLVRGPTPLLPVLMRADVPVAALLVGDYEQEPPGRELAWWRRWMVRTWIGLYSRQQRRALRGKLVMVNSPILAEDLDGCGAKVVEVFTSSLSAQELDQAPHRSHEISGSDLGRSTCLRILYSGRIAEEKGLDEAVGAVDILTRRGLSARLDLVGPVEEQRFAAHLERRMRDLGLEAHIALHGPARTRSELFGWYERSHVFILPSRTEGFPRSIV